MSFIYVYIIFNSFFIELISLSFHLHFVTNFFHNNQSRSSNLDKFATRSSKWLSNVPIVSLFTCLLPFYGLPTPPRKSVRSTDKTFQHPRIMNLLSRDLCNRGSIKPNLLCSRLIRLFRNPYVNMPSELYDSVPVPITIYIASPELELYQAGILIAAVYARAHTTSRPSYCIMKHMIINSILENYYNYVHKTHKNTININMIYMIGFVCVCVKLFIFQKILFYTVLLFTYLEINYTD